MKLLKINLKINLNMFFHESPINFFNFIDAQKTKQEEIPNNDHLLIKQDGIDIPPQEIKNQINILEELKLISNLEILYQFIYKLSGTVQDFSLNTVIYRGNVNSNIMIIGEVPRDEDDISKKPFTGVSGKLLDKILNHVKLDEKNPYITNLIYWQPKNNRNITDEELNYYTPIMMKQIEIIQPKIIILLGQNVLRAILGYEKKITEERGKIHYLNDIPIIATFHPSYLLTSPIKKAFALEDFKLIQSIIKQF